MRGGGGDQMYPQDETKSQFNTEGSWPFYIFFFKNLYKWTLYDDNYNTCIHLYTNQAFQ